MKHSATLVCLLAAVACGEARPVTATKTGANCPTWKGEIETALKPCVACHEELATYDGALAWRDTLAARVNPATADTTHRPLASKELYDQLVEWTGDECQVAYSHNAT